LSLGKRKGRREKNTDNKKGKGKVPKEIRYLFVKPLALGKRLCCKGGEDVKEKKKKKKKEQHWRF